MKLGQGKGVALSASQTMTSDQRIRGERPSDPVVCSDSLVDCLKRCNEVGEMIGLF